MNTQQRNALMRSEIKNLKDENAQKDRNIALIRKWRRSDQESLATAIKIAGSVIGVKRAENNALWETLEKIAKTDPVFAPTAVSMAQAIVRKRPSA